MCKSADTFLPPKGLVEKNVRILPPMGLVDENFINEALPGPRRDPIKLSGPPSEGVAERSLAGSTPRKGLLKEALEAQNLEGVVERCLEFKILVGCQINR